MLSWLCLLSLSLTYSSQRVLIIIDTFYTRLRLSAAFMYWGTSHAGSSPVPVGIISVSFYHHHCSVILERLHTQSVSWLLLLDIFPPNFYFYILYNRPAAGRLKIQNFSFCRWHDSGKGLGDRDLYARCLYYHRLLCVQYVIIQQKLNGPMCIRTDTRHVYQCR
jgi:hypothetical protein